MIKQKNKDENSEMVGPLRVIKNGHGLGIRIPKATADALGIQYNDYVMIEIKATIYGEDSE